MLKLKDYENFSNEFLNGYRIALLDAHEYIEDRNITSNLDLSAMLVLLFQKGRNDNVKIKIQNNESEKLDEIWNTISHYKSIGDVRKRSFYNMIHEIAEIIDEDYYDDGEKIYRKEDKI